MILQRVSLFRVLVAAGLGLAVTIVLALLVAQAAFVGPAELRSALASPDVRQSILLSAACATIAAVLALVVAVPASYALARNRFPGSAILDALLDVPVLLSPVALGLSLLLVLRTPAGDWVQAHLVQLVFEVPGIILAQFILALALEIRVLKSAFEEVNPRLEHVARCLGCTPWGAFRRVAFPLVRPGLCAAFVLGWCRALGDFGATAMLAGAVPRKTETIPIAVYLSLASVRLERAVALALLLTIVALVALLAVRLVGRGRHA